MRRRAKSDATHITLRISDKLRKGLRDTLPTGTGGGRNRGGVSLLLRQLAHLYLGWPIPEKKHPTRFVPDIIADLEAKADRCEGFLNNDSKLSQNGLESVRRGHQELKAWYLSSESTLNDLEKLRAKVLLGRLAILDDERNLHQEDDGLAPPASPEELAALEEFKKKHPLKPRPRAKPKKKTKNKKKKKA